MTPSPFLDLSEALREHATILARLLKQRKARLVLAESCTGGLLASLFTEIPGISNHFCGSQVVYREDSKQKWLGVSSRTLRTKTAVSRQTAEAMVKGILRRTPEATIAAAVTGNLGPSGEPLGRVFIAVLKRGTTKKGNTPCVIELDLTPLEIENNALSDRNKKRIPMGQKGTYARLARRDLAAISTLFLVRASLSL